MQTRRAFLTTSLMAPAVVLLGPACGVAQGPRLSATPACGDAGDVTPAQTEGPYFKPRSPQRASLLEPGVAGTRMVLTGVVLSATCAPIPRALIDIWHADDRGDYDNAGYRLRGHQFADAAGRYTIETIVPGVYPGRTRHFHLKVQAPDQPVLTTQLYFPGEPQNARDFIFDPALVMAVERSGDRAAATYNFVLDDQLRANRSRRPR